MVASDGDRFDDFEHLGGGFGEIGRAFAGKHFAVVRARPEASVPLSDVDRHFAKQSERDHARVRVAINQRALVHLHVDAHFEFRFAVRRRGRRVRIGRTNRGGRFLRALIFFA